MSDKHLPRVAVLGHWRSPLFLGTDPVRASWASTRGARFLRTGAEGKARRMEGVYWKHPAEEDVVWLGESFKMLRGCHANGWQWRQQ